MKYVKLYLPPCPNHPEGIKSWHLVIDNVEDLLKYAKLDSQLYTQALLNTTKIKDGLFEVAHEKDTRTQVVATLLNLKVTSSPEGTKIYPLIELAKICDLKTQGMLKYLTTIGPIRINEVGGYCGYENFVETWSAEVLQVVEKDTIGFPIETEALNASTLILENQHRVAKDFTAQVEAITNDTAASITMLKEKDLSWVIKSITNATTIAFESQFQDAEQLDRFMELFAKLPRKRIIIGVYEYAKSKLLNHKLWESSSNRHEIIFAY